MARPRFLPAVASGGTTPRTALVFDDTVLVTSYAVEVDVTDAALAELRRFLHRLGREARQGEVGVIVDGEYHGIVEYDVTAEGSAR